MCDVNKPVRLVDVGGLEIELDNLLNLMLRDWADQSDETKCFCQSVAMESEDLKKLPSIDPESLRPVAHWEESVCFDDAFWVCSNCKFPSEAIAAPRLYHYCPNCGAKMEGTTNE